MNDTVVAAVDKVVGKKMCGRPERATELGLSRQHDPSFLTHRRSQPIGRSNVLEWMATAVVYRVWLHPLGEPIVAAGR